MTNSSELNTVEFCIELVFNGPELDPDVITTSLEVEPTEALRKGDIGRYSWNNQEYTSKNGVWRLKLLSEEQVYDPQSAIIAVIEKLQNKKANLAKLREEGYKPFLSFCGGNTLDFYFDDDVLEFLGQAGIGLSVWFSNEYSIEGDDFQ